MRGSKLLSIIPYLAPSLSPSAICRPSLNHWKVMLGAPRARHSSTPSPPRSLADLRLSGDASITGLSEINKHSTFRQHLKQRETFVGFSRNSDKIQYLIFDARLTVHEEVELLPDGHRLIPGHAVVGEAGEHPSVRDSDVGQGEH